MSVCVFTGQCVCFSREERTTMQKTLKKRTQSAQPQITPTPTSSLCKCSQKSILISLQYIYEEVLPASNLISESRAVLFSPHRLRIAKMNKEMREMDGTPSGHCEGRGSGGVGGGMGSVIGQTKKGFQTIKNQLSGRTT